jgi:hypothetical protein
VDAVRHHWVGNRVVRANDGPEPFIRCDFPFDLDRLARQPETDLEGLGRKARPDHEAIARSLT